MIFRYDFVFSMWIFAWVLLYLLGIVSYTPILILSIACVIVTLAMLFKIYNNEKYCNVVKFFIIQCVMKFFPLYLIWKNEPIINRTNVVSTLVFVSLYILYMYVNLGSLEEMLKIYDRMLKTSTSKSSEDQYPLTALWNKLDKTK